jgi:energy-coupling factor transporter ATP-binding protein EcfA2
MKQILNLPNQVNTEKKGLKSLISIIEENGNNYVITNDNFKKMVLLVYRIKANVPVIIMGEKGCGKTALITKLNQLLNNGKTTVEIINIHPGINDKKLCKIMDEIDEKARKQNEELWLFFDEINTCLSLSLLTEIFINRTYYGKSINDNIRLIGACNPYRKRQKEKEECGLSLSDDKGKYGFNKDHDLVYLDIHFHNLYYIMFLVLVLLMIKTKKNIFIV